MKKKKGQKIKIVTIRISEDDLEKFRQSAEATKRSISSEFLFCALFGHKELHG